MDLDLQGKIALVTGSSRGIGRGIAEGFLREGATVVLNARGEDALRETAAELSQTWGAERVSSIAGDVADPTQMTAIADEIHRNAGQLDILVCNAGGGRSVPPLQEDLDEWDRVLRSNLLAAANAIKTCAALLADHAGAITVISSIAGVEALGAPATYTTAKAALNAYVKSVTRALAAQGTRINTVCPGNILFEGSVWDRRMADDPESTSAMLNREVAQHRFGTPEEIANAVLFLSSSAAAFVTGANLIVDGGQTRSW
jgi:3-oxoacyl-[acyl-carrier protein] reductase